MGGHEQKILAAALIAVSFGLLTIVQVENQIHEVSPVTLPSLLFPALTVLGIASLVIGVILWISARVSIPSLTNDHRCYIAKKSDLPTIHEIAKDHFGNQVSPLDMMERWYDKNSRVFGILVDVRAKRREKRQRIVGYFCVLPLTQKGVERLEKGEVRGSTLTTDDIASLKDNYAAAYVGAVAAYGFRARGNILTVLHKELTDHWSSKTRVFYTRPVTRAGLWFVEKYEFSPVAPNTRGNPDALYRLEYAPELV